MVKIRTTTEDSIKEVFNDRIYTANTFEECVYKIFKDIWIDDTAHVQVYKDNEGETNIEVLHDDEYRWYMKLEIIEEL